MEFENIENIQNVEPVGPMGDGGIQGGIDHAAIELLIDFVNFVWTQQATQNVLRLNGGFDWRDIGNRLAGGSVRMLGPSGVDFVARHLFTRKYRKAKQAQREAAIRATIKKQRDRDLRKKMKKAYNTKAMREAVYTGRHVDREKTAPPPPYIGADYLDENPALTFGNITDMQLTSDPKSGYDMLNWKNHLTKKLSTECFYEMSAVLNTFSNGTPLLMGRCHVTGAGNGPHLYSTYQSTLKDPAITDTPERYTGWNWPFPMDSGTDDTAATEGNKANKGVGWHHTVFIFAADYPFTTMNPDTKTQDSALAIRRQGRYLQWDYRGYYSSTDNNIPLKFADVIFNNDWTYLTHYYTVYHFDFNNTSHMPYIVEILFFKFKADVDVMDYGKQVLAITRKQEFRLEEYIIGATPAPEDISIVYRKRIYLKGMDNFMRSKFGTDATNDLPVSAPNPMRENSAKWKYVVKNKYVIKRPIIKEYNRTLSEKDFFNKYYDRQRGIYCRMQAFTMEGNLMITENQAIWPVMNQIENTINLPDTDEQCTKLGYGVNVYINKKSRFKLDENIYKQYQPTA